MAKLTPEEKDRRKLERKLKKYKETHKSLNGIDYKLCNKCGDWFPSTDEYFYRNKSNSIDGLHPSCKQCAIIKSIIRQNENPEAIKAYAKENYRNKVQYYKDKFNRWVNNNPERIKQLTKDWRQNNREKLKEYRIERELHKKHDISDEELNELYAYCNSSCMYCGITEEESVEKYGHKLHKDHAINDGSNGIENCILACKSCNSSKRNKDWDVWFTTENPKYTQERFVKIKEWLDKFTI
ncbi:hypothetical protein EDM57_04595 [Brevibacillus gelatini]|uniref:HNH domain-containing protein n=1 Tax=Brevibacillus gelatini TaxID=1655277 RepID=A0A3M8B9C5_9BACL|nr:HNH endonuclease signature motif containing protein [Brevibacillus gelatini]RNB59425.1 hypothetical protein EDM57_04595 [Brevibacillus gelatini]